MHCSDTNRCFTLLTQYLEDLIRDADPTFEPSIRAAIQDLPNLQRVSQLVIQIKLANPSPKARETLDLIQEILDSDLPSLTTQSQVAQEQTKVLNEYADQNESYLKTLKAEMTSANMQSNVKINEKEQQLNQLDNTLKEVAQAAKENQSVLHDVRVQLVDAESQNAKFKGLCHDKLLALEQRAEMAESLYKAQIDKEVKHRKVMEELKTAQNMLKSQFEQLALKHKADLAKLHKEYEEKINGKNPIVSAREAELQRQIHQLKSDLDLANRELKLGNSKTTEILDNLKLTQKPYSEVVQELYSMNLRYTELQKQLLPLEKERDDYMSRVAEYELHCARNLEALTNEDRKTIGVLQRDLSLKHHEISLKQQEINQMQEKLGAIRAEFENRVLMLKTDLSAKTSELAALKSNWDHSVKIQKDQQRMSEIQLEAKRSELEFHLKKQEARLRENFQLIQQQFEEKKMNIEAALQRQTNELRTNAQRLEEGRKSLQLEKDKVERTKQSYDLKIADFERQENQLRTLLLQTQDKYQKLESIQQDYRQQIKQLQQSLELNRMESKHRLDKMKADLDRALKMKATIERSFNECSATRDGILTKVQLLNDENIQLKAHLLELQSKLDSSRAHQQATLEEMRQKVVRSQSELTQCAAKLDQASLTHQHVKKLAEENKLAQKEVERTVARMRDSEKALASLMSEAQQAKQFNQRLQLAIKDCMTNRKILASQAESANKTVADLQRTGAFLSNEIESSAAEFSQALLHKDAEQTRYTLALRAKEDEMKQRVASMEASKRALEKQVKQTQQAQRRTEEALLENVTSQAYIVENLLPETSAKPLIIE